MSALYETLVTVTPVAQSGTNDLTQPFSSYKHLPLLMHSSLPTTSGFIKYSSKQLQNQTKPIPLLFHSPNQEPIPLVLKNIKIQGSMELCEVAGLRYLSSANETYPAHFTAMQNIPAFHFSRLLRPTPNSQIPPPVQEFNPQSSCFSNNSTSDEADEQQLSIIDERKQRRMISNRESARRSRMRKQKHLDELWSQVMRLRNENRQLIDKLNHVSDCNDQVLQENAQLREEVSDLRQMLNNLQLDNSYATLRDLEEIPCNTAHLRAESSNQSITSSMDSLH